MICDVSSIWKSFHCSFEVRFPFNIFFMEILETKLYWNVKRTQLTFYNSSLPDSVERKWDFLSWSWKKKLYSQRENRSPKWEQSLSGIFLGVEDVNKKKITLDHLEKCKTYFSVWIILEKCYCVLSFSVQSAVWVYWGWVDSAGWRILQGLEAS